MEVLEKMLRVAQFYNKNQFIYEDDKKVIFQSYDSIIAIYDKKKVCLTLGRDWDYSKTTKKHLYLFIYDFVRVYPISSIAYEKNKTKAIKDLIKSKVIKYNKKLA